MKILFALQGYPPESRGGIETAVEALARSLVELGHEVAVFSGRPVGAGEGEPTLTSSVIDGVSVHRYLRSSRRDDPIDEHDPGCGEVFLDLLEVWRPDVLHLHHWHRLTNDLVTLAARTGVPSVVTLHDLWTTCARFFRLPDASAPLCDRDETPEACGPCTATIRPMEAGAFARSMALRQESIRQELRLARLVTYGTESHRENLARFGIPGDPARESRWRRSPLGVVDHLLPARSARELGPEEPFVIAHWGNLSALKGVETLARAASRAAAAGPLELRLLGKETESGLVDRLGALAAPAVLIHEGPYDRAELPERLADVDLAAFPTLAAETFALVVDEAVSLGLPLVVSDAGATADRVGGRGRVLPAGDVEAWASALAELRAAPARASLLASEPGPICDRVDWAESLSAAYHEVVAEGAPSRSEAPDRARRRLAALDDALIDIEWFVDRLGERYALARRALLGDEAARTELEDLDPR